MKSLCMAFIFVSSFIFAQQPKILKLKPFRVARLSPELHESSGLSVWGNSLLTFNDGGNSSDIFEVDSVGNVIKKHSTNLQNQDWEALTIHDKTVFIGDFGNNFGNRKDLKIYKIDDFPNGAPAEIPFGYPEQTNFDSKPLKTDFDAEAMIFLNGKLHVFTKEWKSKSTAHYTINPENSGQQDTAKVEEFPIGFLVTDAYYFDKKLYLIGYTKKAEVYLAIFNEADSGLFFNSKPQKYYLGSLLSIGQIEGIAITEKGIYISGEEFKTPLGTVPPYLYFIPKARFTQ